MKLYRATCISRHFDFEAYGLTEADANKALHRTLHSHAVQYGIAGKWYEPDDICIYPISTETGLRDREPIFKDARR